ncbi:hypothetical protein HPP92_006854 [Vanilla planifolia]|uniref:Protein SDA1 n=1 Tax=Vanilla planifolia TaxID=51239 RepID=A0A835RKQ2_VANPL|nr:hypothetical protein HPP92_006854 [Vanilla planifolia]
MEAFKDVATQLDHQLLQECSSTAKGTRITRQSEEHEDKQMGMRIESKLERPIRAFREATVLFPSRPIGWSLPLLQSRMKLDPEGYEAELLLIYGHFESSLHLFLQQSALSSSSDPVVSKDLGDLTMFLAHMTPYYPRRLAEFPH